MGGRAVDVKMYVASTLCKTPGLGTIVLAAGHIEVPFQASKTTDTNMSVDKNVLEERMKVFSKHIEGGGTGSWYPEGRLNREDHQKVGMFRAGGFAIAEEADVEMWGLAFVGVNACWPSRSSMGGRPCHIKMRLFLICETPISICARMVSPGIRSATQVRKPGPSLPTRRACWSRSTAIRCARSSALRRAE